MQHSLTMKTSRFVRTWALLPDVWNGNGPATLCRSRCEDILHQRYMCQATVPHSRARKHDFLLPEEAEWLPHQKTTAEPTAICYALCSSTCLAMMRFKCKEVKILVCEAIGTAATPGLLCQFVNKQARSITAQRLLCWQTPKGHSFTGFCMQQWCSGSWLSVNNWVCKGVTWSEYP
jgi:hypothetical protein